MFSCKHIFICTIKEAIVKRRKLLKAVSLAGTGFTLNSLGGCLFEALKKSQSFNVVNVNTKGKIIKGIYKKFQYFSEHLGNNVFLDLVAIPKGNFTMGAPSTEAKSRDEERPQHQVKLQQFFAGFSHLVQVGEE